VPVVDPLRSHLAELLAKGVVGPFCPKLAGTKGAALCQQFARVLRWSGVGQGLRDAPSKNGLRERSFHHLRHTLTSWMAAAGVDQAARMAVTGHSDVAVHKNYTHAMIEGLRSAVEAGMARLTGGGKIEE